jgi:hypothetical protein
MKTANALCELDREWASALRRSQLRAIGDLAIRYATVTLACLSILVMGSDGTYFPWPNIAASGVLALIAWRATR